jgi:hypothetical protein
MEDEEKKGNGFIARLTETIINNLQVRINNVHVRYEGMSKCTWLIDKIRPIP